MLSDSYDSFFYCIQNKNILNKLMSNNHYTDNNGFYHVYSDSSTTQDSYTGIAWLIVNKTLSKPSTYSHCFSLATVTSSQGAASRIGEFIAATLALRKFKKPTKIVLITDNEDIIREIQNAHLPANKGMGEEILKLKAEVRRHITVKPFKSSDDEKKEPNDFKRYFTVQAHNLSVSRSGSNKKIYRKSNKIPAGHYRI